MEGGSGGAGMDGSHGHDASRRGSETELKGTDKHEQTNGDASRNVTPTAGEQSSSLAIDPALSGANEVPAAEGLNGQEANQPQINDAAIDPALVKQEAPDETMTDADGVDLGGSSSETAASLITLAGGAVSQYLSASFAGAGVNGTNWTQGVPASPDSPNKQYTNNNMSPSLPSMMGHESSPTNRDGKHTTLPPINSIDVLAELATKQDSPQQAQEPGAAQASPAAGYPDGTTRPPLQHLSAQQRQHYMNVDSSTGFYPHHQPHYPPIKDTATSSSPEGYQGLQALIQPATPNSANLFAQGYAQQTVGSDGRRESVSSDFQYTTSDQATPQGPSTGGTMPSSVTEQQTPAAPPRSQRGHSGPLTGGGFKCEFEGCKAPPFQTQYLLNSHANVHSSVRPHYCPVKGCPRGEGGKGFKRKNEMIRHGLVHDSPGYVCPFCPDREHKYPRPDNLQRHVRVHHMDKDKDDPLLREVLSQRPEGGSRGRRRRVGA